MEVLILLIFVTLCLVALGLVFFAWNIKTRSHEHIDRAALFPLLEDDAAPAAAMTSARPYAVTTNAPKEPRHER